MSKKVSSERSSTFNSSNKSTDMDDINYLLQLETLKRFKDDEENIKRQVEEASRKYEETKAEYRYYYELYVEHVKEGVIAGALNLENGLPVEELKNAKSDLCTITKTIMNDKSIAHLNPDILKQFQQSMSLVKNVDRIKEIQNEMKDQKTAVNSIQNLTKNVQSKLELATTQSLDHYTEMTQTLQLEDIAFDSQRDSSLEE